MMLKCLSERRKDFVDCVDSMFLALDRLQHRAAVSGIVDFRNHKIRGISLRSRRIISHAFMLHCESLVAFWA